MRIVQVISNHDRTTANEICEKITDVPRTTLYRHISILIDAQIIDVVEERKVRGSVERTLSLNMSELSKHNTMVNVPQQALRFLMTIYSKFEKYFNNKHVQRNNKIFFNNTVMMMSDLEFDQFLAELQALLAKYYSEKTDGRKPRDISIISAPPEGDVNGQE